MENPRGYYPPGPEGAFKFPVSSSEAPSFTKSSGISSTDERLSESGNLVINSGKHKGVVLNIANRRIKVNNASSAPSKFCKTPHPFFNLVSSALPEHTPEEYVSRAKESFSCSVSRNTMSNYATAVRHKLEAEAKLGRSFSLPMSNEERAFYTTFLIGKNVKKATIAGYLTAIRFYELSQGAQVPALNTELTKHLLKGHENLQRDPKKAVLDRQRRPITGSMLRLLGHSIASSITSEYEQSLLWTVCLTAWWGSFRMSELLCEFRHEFNSLSSLMPSDIQFHEDSIGIWLRDEKVPSQFGNVIEIWKLDGVHDLDPVEALESFVRRRNSLFGRSDDYPLFIHEDGSNLSKAEFNSSLKV